MKRSLVLVVWSLAAAAAIAPIEAAEKPSAPEQGRVEVLGKGTRYRKFMAYRTPVVVTAGGEVKTALQPVWNRRKHKAPKPLGQFQSPLPAEGWTMPGFEDMGWQQNRAPMEKRPGSAGNSPAAMHSATKNSIIFLRGKFKVADPARVRDLRLSLTYVGGVAVYLNGKEVKRAHLPKGELKADTLAEKYPDDLCILPGNELVVPWKLVQKWNRKSWKACREAAKRRYRRLSGVPIDAGLLRKGANVLALRIHRAPVNEAATKAKDPPGGARRMVAGL
jgi:hypothetical protein